LGIQVRVCCGRAVVFLGLVLISGFSIGCASILGGGTHKDISFTSNPGGANVAIYDHNGEEVTHGVTPFNARLKRGRGYFVPATYTVKYDLGSTHKETDIHNSLNAWYIGNILFGGLIGMVIVDPLTGAMWDPKGKVNVELNDAAAGQPTATAAGPPLTGAAATPTYTSSPPLYAPNPASLPPFYAPLPLDAR
jgi:hypothetical protein